MYASINKQLTGFQILLGVLSRPCQREGYETFPRYVSAGNIKLCGEQHAARELRVERACCSVCCRDG
jgi:hypothetical protein